MNIMTEKIHKTQLGDIHYWTNIINKDSVTLVFLPGLTAATDYLKNKLNILKTNSMCLCGTHQLIILRGHLNSTLI